MESAGRIEAAVKAGQILTHRITPQQHDGTINLSGADHQGNFVAVTLTHGGGFGSRVTVDGLGLTLGHGMSRFDTDPAHPNAPGPSKRPLHNMCPTLVTRNRQPLLALGGRGGRKIPNALFEALVQFVVMGRSLAEAMAAPRPHTEGSAAMWLEKHWPEMEEPNLRKLGYTLRTGTSAVLSAVAQEKDGLVSGMR
jgi:gamma-glutamyltranspeptidase/glutathione hydrolase